MEGHYSDYAIRELYGKDGVEDIRVKISEDKIFI